VFLLPIARQLGNSSPRPRRVVIATPARKVREAKGTCPASEIAIEPPGPKKMKESCEYIAV